MGTNQADKTDNYCTYSLYVPRYLCASTSETDLLEYYAIPAVRPLSETIFYGKALGASEFKFHLVCLYLHDALRSQQGSNIITGCSSSQAARAAACRIDTPHAASGL